MSMLSENVIWVVLEVYVATTMEHVKLSRTGVTTNSATATNCVSLYRLRGIQ